MSRRDTMILTVLVNAAFLSILLFLASREDPLQPIRPSPKTVFVAEQNEAALKTLFAEDESKEAEETEPESLFGAFAACAENSYAVEIAQEELQEEEEDYEEVTVKRGDFLEKIARSSGISVSEIKRINHLDDDRIDIGQVLIIPKKKSSLPSLIAMQERKDAEYYVVKSGDNPWTIARKNHVKIEELLRLNGLDEQTARSLKPGDKIRVH